MSDDFFTSVYEAFNLSTPALIFPAISLLMLAYTNRFVVLAQLIRDLDKEYRNSKQKYHLEQISNLRKRMKYIKSMQVLGALAFIFSALSMLLYINQSYVLAFYSFGIGLLPLVGSLVYLLLELNISVEALSIQMDDLENIE